MIVIAASDELQQNGIKIGHEVTEINGLPVKQYAAQRLHPYISASTPQDLDARLYEYYLFIGDAKESLELTLRDEQGNTGRD